MAKKPRRARGSSSDNLSPEEKFRQEYAYVIKDLRRVFLLAGAMFVLLIALNLLLQ